MMYTRTKIKPLGACGCGVRRARAARADAEPGRPVELEAEQVAGEGASGLKCSGYEVRESSVHVQRLRSLPHGFTLLALRLLVVIWRHLDESFDHEARHVDKLDQIVRPLLALLLRLEGELIDASVAADYEQPLSKDSTHLEHLSEADDPGGALDAAIACALQGLGAPVFSQPLVADRVVGRVHEARLWSGGAGMGLRAG